MEGGQNLVVAEGACLASTILENDAEYDDEGGVRNCAGWYSVRVSARNIVDPRKGLPPQGTQIEPIM